MNYWIIISVVICVFLLIVWIIYKNKKDKEEFEKQLNDDFLKPKNEENEM